MSRRMSLRHPGLTASLLIVVALASAVFAGSLQPPAGPVQPTMIPLAFVDPRTALSAENTPGQGGPIPSVFRIDRPGSYYLAHDIVGEAKKVGILIEADGVTLDLMGFRLRGVPDSYQGILADGANDIAIRNGTICDWGQDGVFTASATNVRLADLHAHNNANDGIKAGDNAVITGCTASDNGDCGFTASVNSIIADCTSRDNGGSGYDPIDTTVVTRCVAEGNEGTGISAGRGNTVTNCVARNNDRFGIAAINFETMILR